MPQHIRMVLVEPSHPGNIGAAARAMRTMCLDTLVLVRPARFPHADARARASGALDVLETARVTDSLDDALHGCTLVAGTSARLRALGPPVLTPRDCAARLRQAPATADVALLFGRERTGLTNEEVARCHFLIQIPANPDYSSLNLAAAVQVLAYELFLARDVAAPLTTDGEPSPATEEEMQGLYSHLESAAVASGFLDPQQPKYLMRRLRHLFNRAQPDQREINILRGLLNALQQGKRG
ncbi:MAG: RNA methyltransferase [Gammaproteobacteria bacterium]|nr:RNA methyltransferase [Gammaproteobacteria bacterium]MBU6510651.1 RNA methyltransferase [Gammaproteobacteria bacterium]MDE1984741.1 RNA methyltransferase [Gammaproteobacteria bacterium]MDE2109152.1 RNA methyltransferase [Gammaproteobacteria bacterium]MDE2460046.1 RNA methyltransferase [Gammaproteobacteria bacterium]